MLKDREYMVHQSVDPYVAEWEFSLMAFKFRGGLMLPFLKPRTVP